MGNGSRRVIRAGLLALLCALMPVLGHAACRGDTAELRGDWGMARFGVEVVDDETSRAQGLMNRESLAMSSGMLFVYDAPAELTFWMRNTLIELDMIFVDETGRISHIHERAQPLDETLIASKGPVTAVLEINGGLSKALGLTIGSEMRHPSFDQSIALWPCAE